jgi:hypothetical protein
MADLDQSNAKDTFLGILSYIDSPFKLGVVILLAVLAFTGYFIYANQALLIGAYQKSQELPKMDSSRYDDAAKLLFTTLKVDLVAILEVDPILGKRKLVRIYTKEGRVKDIDGLTNQLFNKSGANNQDVIQLMAGEVPCGEYKVPHSQIGYFYKTKGVNWTCRVSVPPDPNEFIGQITVGWKEQPPLGIEKVEKHYLHIASDMLIKVK